MATTRPPLSMHSSAAQPTESATRRANRVNDKTSAYKLAVSPAASQSLRSISWLINSGTIRIQPFRQARTSSPMRLRISSRLHFQSLPSNSFSMIPPLYLSGFAYHITNSVQFIVTIDFHAGIFPTYQVFPKRKTEFHIVPPRLMHRTTNPESLQPEQPP